MEHFKIACEPFYFEKEDAITGKVEMKQKYSDMIDEDKSLLNLVQTFIKQSPKHVQEKENREAIEAKREIKLQKQRDALAEKQAKIAEEAIRCQEEGLDPKITISN